MRMLFLALMLILSPLAHAGDSPVIASIPLQNGNVITVHADMSAELWALQRGGLVLLSSAVVQDPTFETSWVCKRGLAHTVTTPVSGTTAPEIAAAAMTHSAMVQVQMDLFPPCGDGT